MKHPFQIHFSDTALADLHHRLDQARLPARHFADESLGTTSDLLAQVLHHWRYHYDWRKKEAELNRYPQFLCDIDGVTIHFFHLKSEKTNAPAILLTHGWPDSFLRYAKLFEQLKEYDLIVPSLPGFAFSSLPEKGFCSNAETADLWHKLMSETLGYRQYVAVGGDMGRGVTCYLADRYPDAVRGIHLTDAGLVKELITAPDSDLSTDELAYKQAAQRWLQREGAYISQHSTKPQTVAFALSDSPVAMAAWLLEKYRAWSDWDCLSLDDLCDCFSLYWLSNSAATSVFAYHANSFTLPPLDVSKLSVPTAFALFPKDVLPAPKAWIQSHYPVVLLSEMAKGGHFTALEEPEAFAAHLREFMHILASEAKQ